MKVPMFTSTIITKNYTNICALAEKRQRRFYRKKQGNIIKDRVSIRARPEEISEKKEHGQENTLDFLKKVLKRAPFNISKIRTDQGKEFIANRVKDFLQEQNIQYRNNTPYCPEENGKIERFHRTLNEKALNWSFGPRDSLDEMQYKLNLFLHYYNYQKKTSRIRDGWLNTHREIK